MFSVQIWGRHLCEAVSSATWSTSDWTVHDYVLFLEPDGAGPCFSCRPLVLYLSWQVLGKALRSSILTFSKCRNTFYIRSSSYPFWGATNCIKNWWILHTFAPGGSHACMWMLLISNLIYPFKQSISPAPCLIMKSTTAHLLNFIYFLGWEKKNNQCFFFFFFHPRNKIFFTLCMNK